MAAQSLYVTTTRKAIWRPCFPSNKHVGVTVASDRVYWRDLCWKTNPYGRRSPGEEDDEMVIAILFLAISCGPGNNLDSWSQVAFWGET